MKQVVFLLWGQGIVLSVANVFVVLLTKGQLQGVGVGALLSFLYLCIVAGIYIVIFLTDSKYKLIPHKVAIPAIGFVFLATLGYALYSLYYSYSQLNGDTFGKYLIKAGYFTSLSGHTINGFVIGLASALGIALFFWFLVFRTRRCVCL